MIEHIHQRLYRWADWAAGGQRAKGLGYSPCTLSRWEVSCSLRSVDPGFDEEAANTDKAVTLLPVELRDLVKEHYLKPGTARQKCRTLGVSPKTFYERLHHVHQRIDQSLTEAKKSRTWPVQSSLGRGA